MCSEELRYLSLGSSGVSLPLHLLRIVTDQIVTMKTVTTRIPEDDEAALAELQEEMSADRSEVLRRLIRQGLDD